MNATDRVWAISEKMQGDIARQIRVLLGEVAYDERIFTADERARRIDAMKKCAALNTTDEERHNSWCEMHRESGWVYGETFDPSTKTHPNLLPWNELPATVKVKAKVFDIVSKAARDICMIHECDYGECDVASKLESGE